VGGHLIVDHMGGHVRPAAAEPFGHVTALVPAAQVNNARPGPFVSSTATSSSAGPGPTRRTRPRDAAAVVRAPDAPGAATLPATGGMPHGIRRGEDQLAPAGIGAGPTGRHDLHQGRDDDVEWQVATAISAANRSDAARGRVSSRVARGRAVVIVSHWAECYLPPTRLTTHRTRTC
jgi:hypothetical protein